MSLRISIVKLAQFVKAVFLLFCAVLFIPITLCIGAIQILRNCRKAGFSFGNSVVLAALWHLVVGSALYPTMQIMSVAILTESLNHEILVYIYAGGLWATGVTVIWMLYVFWARGIVDLKLGDTP